MDDASEKTRHSPLAWAGLGMVALVIVAVVVLFLTRGGDPGGNATAASGSSPARSTSTGSPRSPGAQQPTSAASVALGQVRRPSSEPLPGAGEKPMVFFMGAEWCPFCASERWALVEATSRFGRWSGLGELFSRSGQDYVPSLPTYDLTQATYTSPYISLRHKELAKVDGSPLQKLGSFEENLVDEYDERGSIPFLFAAGPPGRYTVELAYSPTLLIGRTFASLRKGIADAEADPGIEAIRGEADAITALICKLDGKQPAKVCSKGSIPALEGELE
jgi:thiol-disulfide isomerase/thioredoxin